jgi:2-phosphosulfolactate phosphatase
MNINVQFTPIELPHSAENGESIAIVIDVLRASTTICVALSSGATSILPATSVEEASATYLRLRPTVRYLGGERKGIKQLGFDAGNSPLEYLPEHVSGKTISFTTSNGTAALKLAAKASKIYIGSFLNLRAAVNYISEHHFSASTDFTIMCAGSNGKFSYEDAACAGGFVQLLSKKFPNANISDTAAAAEVLFAKHKNNLVGFLQTTAHGKRLVELGFADDIECAADLNSLNVVPVINGKAIVTAS